MVGLRILEEMMTFWIEFFAALSAVCELIGTWTVWTTYRQSSNFARELSKNLQVMRDNEPTYGDLTRVFAITLDAVDRSLAPLKQRFGHTLDWCHSPLALSLAWWLPCWLLIETEAPPGGARPS